MEGWRSSTIATVFGSFHELPKSYPIPAIIAARPAALKRLRPLGTLYLLSLWLRVKVKILQG